MLREKHGDAATEADVRSDYLQSWERMDADVAYVAGKKRYTRASLCKPQELVETAEVEHKRLVSLMTKDFKKAAKLEKKLNIALGGYKVRCQLCRAKLRFTSTGRERERERA